jgi:hypothetical protein
LGEAEHTGQVGITEDQEGEDGGGVELEGAENKVE